MLGSVAIVLHAHLPYVRHPEHATPLEERWLHEAIGECYLPLLGVLDRLECEGLVAPITLSISPTLAAMLKDAMLRERFEGFTGRLDDLARRQESALASSPHAGVMRFYRERVAATRAAWDRIGGDVLGAFVRHAREGRIELWTTTATHAYLPGLLAQPSAIRAQLRLGLRSFEALTGMAPRGLWLPECAYDPRLDEDIARAGVRLSLLDSHGITLAQPTPPLGVRAPVLSPHNVAYFGRDAAASREVWSRHSGYPGHPSYRDFYRDIGFDAPEEALCGHLGPYGERISTGLKLHRITGSADKAPYDRALAVAQADRDAADFVQRRVASLRRAGPGPMGPPIAVAPYDAELFGHWWYEGPEFLEATLRRLVASEAIPVTLGQYLLKWPDAAVVEPAASTWGEGGFGEVWAGPAAAPIWRHLHHAQRIVEGALERAGHHRGTRGEALERAIAELMLLQASDWPFMIHRGEVASYAHARIRTHHHRAVRLANIATAPEVTLEDEAFVFEVRADNHLFSELQGEAIRDAFDEWQ